MVDVACFFGFLLVLLYSGIRGGRGIQGEETYLFAGRSTGLVKLTATLVMTEFNTATLLAFSSVGFLAGPRALLLPLVFLIGLFFYAGIVAKKWKEFDGISVAGFFSERYGKDIGRLASIALLVAMAGFSAAYVKSLALLFLPFVPEIGEWGLSATLVGIVLLMTWRGGLISIIRTDTLSFVFILVFFPLLALLATIKGKPVAVINAEVLLPTRFVISLIVLTMFTYILAPWYGQKIFAASSKKVAWQGTAISAGIVFLLYATAVWTTSMLGGQNIENPELALTTALSFFLPRGLLGIGYGILFAASATTLTGVWSAMCSLLVGDFSGKKMENYSRSFFLTGGLAFCSYLLSNLLINRVFDRLILANIPIAALSFALLGGFYWKKANRLGAIASMLVGWAVGLLTFFLYGEEGGYTWYWAVGGIPVIFIAGIIGSLLHYGKGCAGINYENR